MFKVKRLKKYFPVKQKGTLKAVDDVSFEILPGETLGVVGESGCGKSTLGRLLLFLEKPTEGEVLFEGRRISDFSSEEFKAFRKSAQIIFQDPYSSLNPRMTARDIIKEPLDIHHIGSKQERLERVDQLLHLVGLPLSAKERYPHEFSGGQRQRIGIARALAVSPRFIVCDEPISALDVSVQAQIVNLLNKLQEEMGLTYLFIAHDLAMVKYVSMRVAVMYLGHIVELASSRDLYAQPLHPYTQALLSAIPIADPQVEKGRPRTILKGEVPSAFHPPQGCPFSTRCPFARDICRSVKPELKQAASGHAVACHLY